MSGTQSSGNLMRVLAFRAECRDWLVPDGQGACVRWDGVEFQCTPGMVRQCFPQREPQSVELANMGFDYQKQARWGREREAEEKQWQWEEEQWELEWCDAQCHSCDEDD